MHLPVKVEIIGSEVFIVYLFLQQLTVIKSNIHFVAGLFPLNPHPLVSEDFHQSSPAQSGLQGTADEFGYSIDDGRVFVSKRS